MNKLWLLLVMVTPLQLIHSQEVKHAPSVAQCRADRKLRLSMVRGSRAGVTNVSYKELDGWFAQMSHESDSSFHYSE
jgi:hypothetical protein